MTAPDPIAVINAIDGAVVTVEDTSGGGYDVAVWCNTCPDRFVGSHPTGPNSAARRQAAARHDAVDDAAAHARNAHGGEPR